MTRAIVITLKDELLKQYQFFYPTAFKGMFLRMVSGWVGGGKNLVRVYLRNHNLGVACLYLVGT